MHRPQHHQLSSQLLQAYVTCSRTRQDRLWTDLLTPLALQLDWRSFDRSALHAYRRELHLATPNSFVSTYHHWVLSSPNGIGKHSPTMVRRKQARRQTKEQLATTVRKHFNGVGIQENDVIVDFIYKVHSDKAEKASESHKTGSNPT